MNSIYEPIIKKIDMWIQYEENAPNVPYRGNEKIYDEYRSKNDLDCVLSGGNLFADTIISLWTPLKWVLKECNSDEKLKELEPGVFRKTLHLLYQLKKNIERYLPEDQQVVQELSSLFACGITRNNVMILPNRSINSKRGMGPYYDYVPYFLYECFADGAFANYYKNEMDLRAWIEKENLIGFFDNGIIARTHIIDLAGTSNLKDGKPKDVLRTIIQYRGIIENREIIDKREIKG